MAQGWENKRIARELKLHYQTVKNHITAILSKLDVHDRTAAVVTALKQHWIALPDNVRRSN
jgi:DNA-binding NarL/FixJ family response regulator